jgi:hypothetical protein
VATITPFHVAHLQHAPKILDLSRALAELVLDHLGRLRHVARVRVADGGDLDVRPVHQGTHVGATLPARPDQRKHDLVVGAAARGRAGSGARWIRGGGRARVGMCGTIRQQAGGSPT